MTDGSVEITNSSKWLIFSFPSSQVDRLDVVANTLLPNCKSAFHDNKLFVEKGKEKFQIWDIQKKNLLEQIPLGKSKAMVNLEISRFTESKSNEYRYKCTINHVGVIESSMDCPF